MVIKIPKMASFFYSLDLLSKNSFSSSDKEVIPFSDILSKISSILKSFSISLLATSLKVSIFTKLVSISGIVFLISSLLLFSDQYAIYQKLIERLDWIESSYTTYNGPNTVKNKKAGILFFISDCWREVKCGII